MVVSFSEDRVAIRFWAVLWGGHGGGWGPGALRAGLGSAGCGST